MSSRGYNAWLRRKHLPWILGFCDELGLSYRFVAGDWHIRIGGVK